ncbi:DUF3040 domain-containing protein [Streptomyces sp. NPDC005389]|uniref:DUF3040 domain-containing protein n=1 Tax=unclassified Streptomyces TaxID=2593676 RepID=UPI00339F2CC6
MSHSTDDRRVLAEIERRLARDDPDLVALFATLIQQFPPVPEEPRPAARTERRRRLRRKPAVILFVLIAVLGLILTALLSAPSSPSPGEDAPPSGTRSGSLLHPSGR